MQAYPPRPFHWRCMSWAESVVVCMLVCCWHTSCPLSLVDWWSFVHVRAHAHADYECCCWCAGICSQSAASLLSCSVVCVHVSAADVRYVVWVCLHPQLGPGDGGVDKMAPAFLQDDRGGHHVDRKSQEWQGWSRRDAFRMRNCLLGPRRALSAVAVPCRVSAETCDVPVSRSRSPDLRRASDERVCFRSGKGRTTV